MSAPDHFAETAKRRTDSKPRGFALLSPERKRELASMGGKRRSELGVGHRFTKEEASIAAAVSAIARTDNMLRDMGADLADFESIEQMHDAARKYMTHREGAGYRGIGFEMTFPEWWGVWKASGHWDQRGAKSADCYVMSRHKDAGPYRVGNVTIATVSQNMLEAWETAPNRFAHRRKVKPVPTTSGS